MRQALLEALFTRCVFDLYTLRGSTLLSPLSQIKAQRGPPNLAKVTQVVHGKARAQTQRVWLEISAPVSTGVPLGGPPRARGHYLCRLLMLRHHLGVCAQSPRSSGESSQQAGSRLFLAYLSQPASHFLSPECTRFEQKSKQANKLKHKEGNCRAPTASSVGKLTLWEEGAGRGPG